MKALGLAIVCVFALTACGKSSNPRAKASQPGNVETEKVSTDEAQVDPAKDGDQQVDTTTAAPKPVAQAQTPATPSPSKPAQTNPAKQPAKAPAKAPAKPKVAAAPVCKVPNDGADIMKTQMQLKQAYAGIQTDFTKAKEAKAKRDEAGMLGHLGHAHRTSAAVEVSCVKMAKDHEQTAKNCSKNKELLKQLSDAKASCKWFHDLKTNLEIRLPKQNL